MSLVVDCNEKAPRSSVDETESLAGQAHGGGVHNRQILLNVLGQEPEEQLLISVLQ